MKIKIDTTRCAGCGLCEETLPSLFYIDGYQSATQEDYESLLSHNEILKRKLIELVEICPFQAIELQPDQSAQPKPNQSEPNQPEPNQDTEQSAD
ncbi:MAG: ferredoxin [Spirochaetales bacterium]|nr:ferredoxin [Spirochaetales bacterium]